MARKGIKYPCQECGYERDSPDEICPDCGSEPIRTAEYRRAHTPAVPDHTPYDWGDEEENDEKYWFTKDKIDTISKIHNYLDSLPEIGKVLSFSSIVDVATQLNNNKPLGTLEMGVLYTKIPENIKKEIINPYISIKDNEARISLRIIDSQKDLKRNELIKKINLDLQNEFGLSEDRYKLAGVMILFNNLLQSLFKSQILTLGLVMLGIFGMFVILFKNIKLSLIGVVPNFIAAFFILGIIGMLEIPLDMMTITIAAITIGIAVDNSIHYILSLIHI